MSWSLVGSAAAAEPAASQNAGAPHQGSIDRPVTYAVEIGSCEGLDREQVEHFLVIEFGATVLGASSALPKARVFARCEGERVSIEATFSSGTRVARDLYLYEVQGKVGARLLALAIAELVRRAPGPEIASEASSEVEEDELVHQPKLEMRSGLDLNAKAELMAWSDGLALWGAGLGAGWFSQQTPLTLHLDLGLVGGSKRFGLGEANVTVASATPQIGIGKRWPEGSLAGSIGYRVGVGRIVGQADSATAAAAGRVTGALMGPVLAVHSSATLYDPIELVLTAEAGHVTMPLVGEVEGERGVRLDGLWWRLALGVGIVL